MAGQGPGVRPPPQLGDKQDLGSHNGPLSGTSNPPSTSFLGML